MVIKMPDVECLYPSMMVINFKFIHCNYYKKRKGKRYVRYCDISSGVTPKYTKQFNKIVERRIKEIGGK